MKKIDEIYQALLLLEERNPAGVSAFEMGEVLKMDRANISRHLNELYKQNKLDRVEGRPVRYRSSASQAKTYIEKNPGKENSLDRMVGAAYSLQVSVQQAKAAVLYPPRGLHTLLLGETGVGKSMFAELMYKFALETNMIKPNAPFIRFNCADYADNPQLIVTQIFGVKKGAYTGADRDREGLLKQADGGILFLDEIHRLSPQGQEMLFLFMDQGFFRPLGETEREIGVEVQIIAATTEEPQSFLLKTFTRRIPMVITLPPLRDRSLKERYALIKSFIKDESKRVGKSIYVNKNSLMSYLLYDCVNNIGQLKSDIQLACAKAFLAHKTQNESYILITQADVPHHVKKGLMRLHAYREDIELILKSKGDILRFSSMEEQYHEPQEELQTHDDFYGMIEAKIHALKNKGMKEGEINQILNIDIDSHFERYIGNLPHKYRKDEIIKVVDKKIVDIVEEILTIAQKRLNKEYDEKIFFGLALHLHSSIERIRNRSKIYHPNLNFIRSNYVEEFLTAMEAAKWIDQIFQIETPLDEIGYLTMFLASDPYNLEGKEEGKVGLLLIMHGNSTASSMAQVANTLVGVDHAAALDMPLSMKPEVMYELAKESVIRLNEGKGVLLLVDMGSLTNFGEMIYEDTGIITKTIEAVSTPIAIDACRKAVMGRSLLEIYKSFKDSGAHGNTEYIKSNIKKKNIIITACFTGEGASEKLKQIIEEKLHIGDNLRIIPLNILNRKAFVQSIEGYRKEHNVLAIAGTIELHIDDIPFVSAGEILTGNGLKTLQDIIEGEEQYINMGKSIGEYLHGIDGERIIQETRQAAETIARSLQVQISNEVRIGIILHMIFLVDKLSSGGKETDFQELAIYREQFSRELLLVKESIKSLEASFGIDIGENELAYLCKMFLANHNK